MDKNINNLNYRLFTKNRIIDLGWAFEEFSSAVARMSSSSKDVALALESIHKVLKSSKK